MTKRNAAKVLAATAALHVAQDAVEGVDSRRAETRELATAATVKALGERPGRGGDKAARRAWILRYEEEQSARGADDLVVEMLASRDALLVAFRVWMVEMNGGTPSAEVLTDAQWEEMISGPRRSEVVEMAKGAARPA